MAYDLFRPFKMYFTTKNWGLPPPPKSKLWGGGVAEDQTFFPDFFPTPLPAMVPIRYVQSDFEKSDVVGRQSWMCAFIRLFRGK